MIVQDLSHRRAWDLIPLVINGTAVENERDFVKAHLQDCADCRDEYAFQLRLHAGMQAVDAGAAANPADAAPALRQLLERIDGEDRDAAHLPSARRAGTRRPRSRRPSRLLGAAVVAQAFALALLGASLLERPSPVPAPPAGAYETLSSGAQVAAATIRLVPAPALSLSALQALLSDNGLRVVSVSGDGSIYSLAPAPGAAAESTPQVVARLRASAGVLLVEPLAASPQ